MKITLEDLKKAVKWVEANSFEIHLKIEISDHKIVIRTFDRYQAEVEIYIFEEGSMMPKIRKIEGL